MYHPASDSLPPRPIISICNGPPLLIQQRYYELQTEHRAKHAPEVHIKGQGSDTKYSLLLTDPDAPDPEKPVNREWLHWLVVNIPPSGDLSKGEEVVPYMGPAPPIGVHRYVFSVFRQPGNVKVSKAPSRAKFSTRGFAAEHTLGDPAAVLFFRSRAPK
ncbi:hypothetical protein WJX72_009084 [[Myrmecia] bisecta]|uniref:Uncharacterized protein n=1 Tax=[Myrmecia] bisecta TaxID=41462 RepID=A0AAW1QSM8_9CHLO